METLNRHIILFCYWVVFYNMYVHHFPYPVIHIVDVSTDMCVGIQMREVYKNK